jgi:hypothetical protein
VSVTSDLLKTICDYRILVGRSTVLRAALEAAESDHLVALEKVLAAPPLAKGTLPPFPHRRHSRTDVSLHATIDVGDRAIPVIVWNIGAGGLMVKHAPSLPAGARTLVTLTDSVTRRAYLFPARVVWSAAGRMGLAFTGIPKQIS